MSTEVFIVTTRKFDSENAPTVHVHAIGCECSQTGPSHPEVAEIGRYNTTRDQLHRQFPNAGWSDCTL